MVFDKSQQRRSVTAYRYVDLVKLQFSVDRIRQMQFTYLKSNRQSCGFGTRFILEGGVRWQAT